jgi:hypothetical protein
MKDNKEIQPDKESNLIIEDFLIEEDDFENVSLV